MASELLASSPLALALLDRDLRFVAVNEAAAEINGIPAAEHAGRLWSELLPALAERYGPAVRRAIEEDRPILDDEVSGETPIRDLFAGRRHARLLHRWHH
jgi:PAS domain-containing protein